MLKPSIGFFFYCSAYEELTTLDPEDERNTLKTMEQSYEWLEQTIFRRENLFNSQKSDDIVMPQIGQLDKQIARALKVYGCETMEEFEQLIREKRATIGQAEYIQTGIRLTEEAMKASDFETLSKQDHTDEIPGKHQKYLTQDERAVYNYYYAKGGKEAAEEYLKYIEYSLNSRRAQANAEAMDGKTLQQLAFGAYAGIDNFAGGIANLFNDDNWIPPNAVQQQSQQVREDLYGDGGLGGTLARGAYDVISTTANMLPSVLTSAAVGLLNPAAGAATGTMLMSASATGNAYTEALNNGYEKGQARMYSTLVGASEAGLQLVLGGIGKLGGVGTKQVLKAIDGIDNAFARISLKLGANMIAEGGEEALQELLTPLFETVALGHTDGVSWEAVGEAFILGGITAGLLEGGGTVKSDIDTQKVGAAILDNGCLQGLKDLGTLMPKGTEAHRLSQIVDEHSGTYRIGELYAAIYDAMNSSKSTAAAVGADSISARSGSVSRSAKPTTDSYNSAPTTDLSNVTPVDIRTDQLLMAQNPNAALAVNTNTKSPTITAPNPTHVPSVLPKSVTPEIDIDLANAIEAATAAVEGRRPNLIDSQTTKTVTEPTMAELIEIANAAVEGRKPNLPAKSLTTPAGDENSETEYNKDALYRRHSNAGPFSHLTERMSKKHIKQLAQQYEIDLKGVSIHIDTNEELLRLRYFGRADPEHIGGITFFPNAFESREELLRTLYHEKVHVEQYRKYGIQYVQNNRKHFEELAYKAEESFIDSLKERGLL